MCCLMVFGGFLVLCMWVYLVFMVLSIAAGSKLSKATRNRNQVGPATAAACVQLLGQHFRSEKRSVFSGFLFIGVLRCGFCLR